MAARCSVDGGVMRNALVGVLLVCAIAAPVYAQSDGSERTVVEDAEPYTPDEFAPWLLDLRRAEIVAIGSVPFTMLASQLLYSIGRYAYFSISAGQSRTEYLPALFAPQGAIPLTAEDNRNIILGAVGLSLLVALGDYLLGLGPDEQSQSTQP